MNKRIKWGFMIFLILILSGCESKKYTIKIVNDNGEILSSVLVNEGDNIENVDDPIKDGYIFVGWLKDGAYYDTTTPIYDDLTLTAKYTEVPEGRDSYIVTFNFGEYKKTKTVKIGEKIDKPNAPIKSGYKFLGWYIGNEKYDFSMKVLEDITLTAKWEAIQYVRVSFDSDGGQEIKSQMIEKGTKIKEVNTPIKEGYKFLCWMYEGEIFNPEMIIETNIILVAKYEKI